MPWPLRVATLLIALSSSSASAQPADTAARTMLATVVNTRGETMVDFDVDDFVVSEGEHEREVLDVHVADYPIAIVIDDQAPADQWPTMQSAVARFVTRIGERPVLIAAWSNGGTIISPLDAERADTLARLRSYTPAPGSTTTLLAALAAANRPLTATDSPFSALVVVASRAIPSDDPGRSDRMASIVESPVNVHVVEARTAAPNVAEPPDADLLRIMANQTRGQYTVIYSAASFSIALDRLADRLAGELMIQYLVPPGERTSDVKVGVKRPGALVLGRGVSK